MTEARHIRILLSGGIGAGKTAAAELIAARSVPVIHADSIGHAVLEPEGESFNAVAARWPEVVVEDRVDRKKLAEIVFADRDALTELESMTHPAIAARILNLVAEKRDAPLVVVELPLLLPILGAGWTRVVVDAPLEVRRRRLRDRGLTEADVAARMAAQPTADEWKRAADHVLDNSGSLDDLEAEVDALLERLTANSRGADSGRPLSGER